MKHRPRFPKDRVKQRKCLKCGREFRSRHFGIRLCDGCKHLVAKTREGVAAKHRYKVHAEFMKTGPSEAEIQESYDAA